MCLRRVLECVLGLHPCVSEIVFRMCSQVVLECVLGMCPQGVLAVSRSVSSSWPWHVPHWSSQDVSSGCSGVWPLVVLGCVLNWIVCPQSVYSGCRGVYLFLAVPRGMYPGDTSNDL